MTRLGNKVGVLCGDSGKKNFVLLGNKVRILCDGSSWRGFSVWPGRCLEKVFW